MTRRMNVKLDNVVLDALQVSQQARQEVEERGEMRFDGVAAGDLEPRHAVAKCLEITMEGLRNALVQFDRIAEHAGQKRAENALLRRKLRALRRQHTELQHAHERTVRGLGAGRRQLVRLFGDEDAGFIARLLQRAMAADLDDLRSGRLELVAMPPRPDITEARGPEPHPLVVNNPEQPAIPRRDVGQTKPKPQGGLIQERQ